jgi:ubiquinone/menaquinone biosynthesis C-methylase UbiE
MAVLNADMERRAVDQLSVSAGARLLAIGFGPGVGVTYALDRVRDGIVAGVDPSRVMLEQTQRRVKRAGRTADLRLGTAAQLPWADHTFDAAVSVNNIQLWDLPGDLRNVHRILVTEGQLSIAVHASMLGRRLTAATPKDAVEHLAAIVSDSGFAVAQSEMTGARTGRAIYLVAIVR